MIFGVRHGERADKVPQEKLEVKSDAHLTRKGCL